MCGEALSESLSGHMPSSWEAELRGLRGGASARALEGNFPGFGTWVELSLEMLWAWMSMFMHHSTATWELYIMTLVSGPPLTCVSRRTRLCLKIQPSWDFVPGPIWPKGGILKHGRFHHSHMLVLVVSPTRRSDGHPCRILQCYGEPVCCTPSWGNGRSWFHSPYVSEEKTSERQVISECTI